MVAWPLFEDTIIALFFWLCIDFFVGLYKPYLDYEQKSGHHYQYILPSPVLFGYLQSSIYKMYVVVNTSTPLANRM